MIINMDVLMRDINIMMANIPLDRRCTGIVIDPEQHQHSMGIILNDGTKIMASSMDDCREKVIADSYQVVEQ